MTTTRPIDRIDDLSDDHRALVDTAAEARSRAYVPYTGFAAAAAVRCDDGSIVTGVVVENISLGLAVCAERAALFATVGAGRRPVALALVAPRTDGGLTEPCGACLQVALELGGHDLTVVSADDDGEARVATLRELLPRGPWSSRTADWC